MKDGVATVQRLRAEPVRHLLRVPTMSRDGVGGWCAGVCSARRAVRSRQGASRQSLYKGGPADDSSTACRVLSASPVCARAACGLTLSFPRAFVRCRDGGLGVRFPVVSRDRCSVYAFGRHLTQRCREHGPRSRPPLLVALSETVRGHSCRRRRAGPVPESVRWAGSVLIHRKSRFRRAAVPSFGAAPASCPG